MFFIAAICYHPKQLFYVCRMAWVLLTRELDILVMNFTDSRPFPTVGLCVKSFLCQHSESTTNLHIPSDQHHVIPLTQVTRRVCCDHKYADRLLYIYIYRVIERHGSSDNLWLIAVLVVTGAGTSRHKYFFLLMLHMRESGEARFVEMITPLLKRRDARTGAMMKSFGIS